ncbi:AraC family transcriptional regulator [soil metagenome]
MSVNRATIPISNVVDILKVVERRGIDPVKVLERANVSRALLESNLSRLTQPQFTAVIRQVVRATRDEFWGLGRRPVTIGTFSSACRIALAQRTLGEAVRAGLHHYRLCTDDITGRLWMNDGVARIRVVSTVDDPMPGRLLQATFLYFLYGLMCWYAGRRVPLLRADFAFARSQASDDAVRAFNTEVRFDQPSSELHFPEAWLKTGCVQDSYTLDALLRESPGSLAVGFRDRTTMSERLTRLLRQNLSESIDLDYAASHLAISAATLRRRLAIDGHSFQGLKDVIRRDASIELLHGTNQTLEQIAEALGFSDVSTYHRAFKRWTGSAPGDYRRKSHA